MFFLFGGFVVLPLRTHGSKCPFPPTACPSGFADEFCRALVSPSPIEFESNCLNLPLTRYESVFDLERHRKYNYKNCLLSEMDAGKNQNTFFKFSVRLLLCHPTIIIVYIFI